jgi:hypothetical protein
MGHHAQSVLRPRAGATSRTCPCADQTPARRRRSLWSSSGTRAVARISISATLALTAASWSAADAAVTPRIGVHGNQLYAGTRPWRAWGMNWGVGDHAPVIAYFDDPTAANLAVLRAELRIARAMGANSMRIYLELGQVMATPTRPRQRSVTALRRLLALAQSDGIYLDITGDLVWRPSRAPAWYKRMPWQQRWQVQARFWKAVAHAASTSPAVLCYELTSEPVVAQTRGYYYGQIGEWWFVQSIATQQPPAASHLARSWTSLLASAVRSEDDRPVSIGLLPFTSGPFAPANIAGLLDLLIVHEYPTAGQAPAAVSLLRSFAAFHKPVLLGETFILADDASDASTQNAFLTGAAPHLCGAFEFFDGRDPSNMQVSSVYDAVYQKSLRQFHALRPLLSPARTTPTLDTAYAEPAASRISHTRSRKR